MATAYQAESHSTSVVSSSATITINKPTGTVDGDLLIAYVIVYANETITVVPSGWTLVQGMIDINAFGVYIYSKIASSEGASWAWTKSSSTGDSAYMCLRIDGMDSASPIGTYNYNYVVNDGTPSYNNTITPQRTDSLLVMAIFALQDSTSGYSNYAIATSNPTWTERVDQLLTANRSFACATATRPEITATGNSSVTIGVDEGTEDSYCSLIAINRINSFPVIINDSVSGITDSQIYQVSINQIDTITNTDILENQKKIWKNEDKSASPTWLNEDKS